MGGRGTLSGGQVIAAPPGGGAGEGGLIPKHARPPGGASTPFPPPHHSRPYCNDASLLYVNPYGDTPCGFPGMLKPSGQKVHPVQPALLRWRGV